MRYYRCARCGDEVKSNQVRYHEQIVLKLYKPRSGGIPTSSSSAHTGRVYCLTCGEYKIEELRTQRIGA